MLFGPTRPQGQARGGENHQCVDGLAVSPWQLSSLDAARKVAMVPSVACFENFRWSKLTAHSLRLNALHDRCQFGVKQAALTDLLDVLAQVLQK